jgi:fatty acid desaturase
MKYLGWISLLSVQVGGLLGFAIMNFRSRRRCTTDFTGLGEAIVFVAIVFASAVVGTITGAIAFMSGISTLPVIIGLITSLLVVCVVVVGVLCTFLHD